MTERTDECLDGLAVECLAASGMASSVDEAPDGRGAAMAEGQAGPRLTSQGDERSPECDDADYVTALLDTLVERRSSVDRAEADVLALVMEFADACPSEDDVDGPLDGPPTGAAETAIVELAARLGMSYRSAAHLVTEALELRDRLPRLWTLVRSGRLQAWKARQVARVTVSLSDEAARFIDAQAAVSGRRNQLPDLRKLVLVAINRCDPDLAEGLEEAALAERGVDFTYSASTDAAATARLEATLDLLDALDLDATVSRLATEMGRLGDESPLGTRRAGALGLLANPQRTLDLFGDPVTPTLEQSAVPDGAAPQGARATLVAESNASSCDDTPARGVGDGSTSGESAASGRRGARGRRRVPEPWDGRARWNDQVGLVYLHLDAADLTALTDGPLLSGAARDGATGAVDLERLGAASLSLVRDWLGRVTRVSVRPVLDLAADDPVDRHDPPETMREQVVLRDGSCVFPGCSVSARRCDLDHIEPYVPLDSGGPPDQTSAANLACLCRRHHRMKTHLGWGYARARDGTYRWTDPRGVSYTTAPGPLYRAPPREA